MQGSSQLKLLQKNPPMGTQTFQDLLMQVQAQITLLQKLRPNQLIFILMKRQSKSSLKIHLKKKKTALMISIQTQPTKTTQPKAKNQTQTIKD
jgi:hypothetical protein